LFEDIKQVEPGSIVTYNYKNNTIKIESFFDLYQSNNLIDYNQSTLMNLLTNSVKRRIHHQNPALTLSGGLDSSIILDLVNSLNTNIKDCFSISFTDGGIYDEQDIVKILAKKYNVNLHLIPVTQDMLIDNLEESLYFSEDVTINLHMPAKFLLFQEIKKHGFNISLSGEGSDEFFLGYSHFFPNENPLLKGMHLPDSNQLKINQKNIPTFLQAKLSIGYKIQELLEHNIKVENINLYNSEQLNQTEQASYLWSKYALSNSILIALGDKMEMASTIEGRTPFLDIDVLNYIMSVKLEDKYSTSQDKILLRELFKNRLPKEVINTKKHPFIAPPLISTTKGIEFVRTVLMNWNTTLISKEKINLKLDSLLTNNDINELRTYDPVFMILVSLALIQKRMIDD
jgi:asparagine synthase (glutamine-hydrolysing)